MNKFLALLGTAAGVLGTFLMYKVYKSKKRDDETQDVSSQGKVIESNNTISVKDNNNSITLYDGNSYPDFNYDSVADYSPKELENIPVEVLKQVKLQGWDLNSVSPNSQAKRADSPYTSVIQNTFNSARSQIYRQLANYRLSFAMTDGDVLDNLHKGLQRAIKVYIG